MKLILLVYLFFFCWVTQTQTANSVVQTQYGAKELLFSSPHSLVHKQPSTSSFDIALEDRFRSRPTIVIALSGFEGTFLTIKGVSDSGLTSIYLDLDLIQEGKVKVVAKVSGVIKLVRVSYFAFERHAAESFGLYLWDRAHESRKLQKEAANGVTIIERQQRQNARGSFSVQAYQSIYHIPVDIAEVRLTGVSSFLTSLLLDGGISHTNLTTKFDKKEDSLGSIIDVALTSRGNYYEPDYFIIFILEVNPVLSQRLQFVLFSKVKTIGWMPSQAANSPQQKVFYGLSRASIRCVEGDQMSEEHSKLNSGNLEKQNSFCNVFHVLEMKAGHFTGEIKNGTAIRLLATSCPSGQMWNTWNWTYLLTVTSRDQVDPSTSSPVCMPCPLGCATCKNISSSKCQNAYCLTCDSQFDLKKVDSDECPDRYYCACKNSNLYPDPVSGNCQNCNSIIPYCLSCSVYRWAGTYCSQCDIGYYGTGNWPRSCLPCPSGCNKCSSATSCDTCANTFVRVSGACVCNTTQNLFYNSNTNTCTSCSLAVTNCTSCTGSGVTTTCNACLTGSFVSGGVCQPCAIYCSACTSSACTLCVSSSFTISGTNCICDASQELYLNTATSPVSCSLCSTFIANCVDCTGTVGSLSCAACVSGYYYDGTSCQQCMAYCLDCSNSTTCNNCSSTFIFNGTDCACDGANGYTLNAAGTACLLCSALVPNCQTCVLSPSLYCATCSDPFYSATVNATSCTLCPIECTNCTDATTCGGCVTGYSLQLNNTCTCDNCPVCSTITAGCSVCNATSCLLCSPGAFLNASGLCELCPVGCSTCDNATFCDACLPPFVYNAPNCECNTAVGQYYDQVNQICTTCGSIYTNCTSCTGSGYSTNCTACSTGTFLLNETYCEPCPIYATACTAANASTVCKPTFALIGGQCVCDAAYQMFLDAGSGTCLNCASLIVDCVTCAANVSQAAGVECTACADGFYIDGDLNCTACPATCLTCNSPTDCVDCVNSYSLLNGSCACDSAAQMYDLGNECAPCYAFINLCLECSGQGPSNVSCLSCPSGTYLSSSNDSCIACPDNCDTCDAGGCLNCTSGFNATAGSCVFLDTCQSFSGIDSNCLDCANSTSTNNATNITTTTELCLSCQAGFFLFQQTACVSCPSTCATCTSYFSCLTCQPTLTLISGSCECNPYNNEVLSNGVCVVCSALLSGCLSCNSTAEPVECSTCLPTFYLNGNSCSSCLAGCLSCFGNGSCTACVSGYTHDPALLTCTNSIGCSSSQFYDGSTCVSCNSTCLTCLDSFTCLTCQSTYELIDGACVCDSNQGYFASSENSVCNQCGSFNSSTYGVYTANCQTCAYSSGNLTAIFECAICDSGYYLSGGRCMACQEGCVKCTGNSSCYQCSQPAYVYSGGVCVCNNNDNYFLNGTTCDACNSSNCVICSDLTTCVICATGYFLNASNVCEPQICGDGSVDGSEECDDGNTLDGDGCSSACLVELYYLCINPAPGGLNSTCYIDNDRFRIQLNEQVYSCNSLAFKFELTGTESFANCDFIGFLASSTVNASLTSYSVDGSFLTYSFALNQTIQGQTVSFVFDPTTLCISDAYNFVLTTLTTTVNPTNNYAAVFYPGDGCSQQKSLETLVDAVQYASYGTLLLSALPCKIVGLELFGVLQLSFFSIGSMDNVNLMMSPLKAMRGTNGLNLNLGGDTTSRLLTSTFTPERINAIDYRANFIRNCNLMFLVVVAIIAIAFLLFLVTFCCKGCAPALHRLSKRLFKEVLLTLILFNMLNFAYSAGLHFKYAPKDDPLYLLGTLAAVATLIVPVLMAVALQCTEEEGFGEFKDKLKRGCLERAYFVVTIVYRMAIGLYLSSANEDDLSTLIVLALSLLFLLYNLVNLPFSKAYHNYRANVCHLTQFVILFVTMYYRSMKSNSSIEATAHIFSPVYLEYSCIVIALVVSTIVLGYEIYLFVKGCCASQAKETRSLQSMTVVHKNNETSGEIEVHPQQNKNILQVEAFDDYDIYT